MSVARHHAEWLSLVEVSGPFLSMPVLLRVFPEGLDRREDTTDARIRVHAAHEEWLDNQGGLSPDPAIHRAWLRFMLREVLEIDGELLAEGQSLPPECAVALPEHGERLIPTLAVLDPPGRPTAGKARVLIDLLPRGQSLESPLAGGRWKASPATRMMTLLHGAGARIGLITNGEHWVLVHAAPGETATYASFYSSLFLEESLTLRAFQSLLGARRLFGVADEDTLEALFRESGQNQQEVTDQLGAQVRRAVEVLIQTIDKVDHDRGRELLRGVSETTLYEAAVTVMMRLVFLFAAEERDLLLLGDPLYDQHYAVSTLRDQLQAAADAHGSEVLQRRHDAWSRLLATFRAVHGGVRHEAMRLPPYGGSLFDPDRFPFLEGRAGGTRWREAPALPLAVDNLTVLDLLRSLQVLEVRVPGGGPAEARRLSFRALDVEQIGHVYEGLLDHTARRAKVPVLSLKGSKNQEPEVEITALEGLRAQGEDKLLAFLKDVTGRSEAALRKAAGAAIAKEDRPRWLLACGNDPALFERVLPFAGLVREDVHGRPVVFGEGAVYVTEGQERRATGTHYTPKSLTEPIVQYTLEPLVYEGPAEGWVKEKWRRKGARELLELRVCDMAMGSGAFLVQACRYLSERLVEAWADAEDGAGGKLVVTPEGALGTGDPSERPLPKNQDERLAIARRVVADRCLYGVDKNPMAVEMAKLSLWLVTLQRDRPFTFVDHALRCGDSLVGLTDPAQIEQFHLDPVRGKKVHATQFEWTKGCGPALARAMELRKKLESFSVESVRDAEEKGRLLREAEAALGDARLIADLVIGAAMATATKGEKALDDELIRTSALLAAAFGATTEKEREERKGELRKRAVELLNAGKGPQHAERRAFHWVLDFPEVFGGGERRGFDAFVGNPPFQWGMRLSSAYGDEYYAILQLAVRISLGTADLCAHFLRRAARLAHPTGFIGLIAVDTIAQGDTRQVGLGPICEEGYSITRATSSEFWPGTAGVKIATLLLTRELWQGTRFLDGIVVPNINSWLSAEREEVLVHRLAANARRSYVGHYLMGQGFILTVEEKEILIRADPQTADVISPYLRGEDINQGYQQTASAFALNWGALSLQECRDRYPSALQRVERLVKPERDLQKRSANRERWWQYAEIRPGLNAMLEKRSQVTVQPFVSKYLCPTIVASRQVFASPMVVIDSDGYDIVGVLHSAFHDAWTRRFSSKMGDRIRYSSSDAFETFPFPVLKGERANALRKSAEVFYGQRQAIMLSRQQALTTTLNLANDPTCNEKGITALRELWVVLDRSVADCYNWDDLQLGHDFHETSQGIRFTISETTRREVLGRLLELNHQRYAEEVAQGLHEGKSNSKKARGVSPMAAKDTAEPTEQGAFNFGDAPPQPAPAKRGRKPKSS